MRVGVSAAVGDTGCRAVRRPTACLEHVASHAKMLCMRVDVLMITPAAGARSNRPDLSQFAATKESAC